MEKVFWLMYLADLVGNVAVVGVIAAIAAVASVVILGIGVASEAIDRDGCLSAFRVLKWLAIPIAIAAVLPSHKTVQLMAVASASDAVASTQLGQKGVEAINAVLDRVIKESKKEPGK